MPSKKEIEILKYLYRSKNRYDGGKKGDTKQNIKNNLLLNDNDISDISGSEFFYFNQPIPGEPIICITNKGNIFVENYSYKKTKEIFYWIFGSASVVAAIFAVWAVLK